MQFTFREKFEKRITLYVSMGGVDNVLACIKC